MGDSCPGQHSILILLGQQSILVLLGQQSRMPMREQQFLICYKEMLAIETTVTSANLWNSCFHQNSGDSSSPCFARTAVHLNLLGVVVLCAFLPTSQPRSHCSNSQPLLSTSQPLYKFRNHYFYFAANIFDRMGYCL